MALVGPGPIPNDLERLRCSTAKICDSDLATQNLLKSGFFGRTLKQIGQLFLSGLSKIGCLRAEKESTA